MNYPLLEKINSPEDLKVISKDAIPKLCEEIRAFLVDVTAQRGGHLASNLGVVELSVALHRVFNSPNDRIIFDVGHQSYVHKIITGRKEGFSNLRVPGGLSGFTRRDESIHDHFGAGHSSTSISAALGFAEADRILSRDCYNVAVVGDGSFTGGMIHEALNNVDADLPLIIILNENGMSISSNKGAFASYLSRFRASAKYQKVKNTTRSAVLHIPFVGKPIKRFVTFVKKKIKNLLLPANYFEELGLQYIGPVDGNNYEKVEKALRLAKNLKKTVVVHLVTVKGKGYKPAENEPASYHSVSYGDKPGSFQEEAANTIMSMAENNERIVTVTAAMGIGTGLEDFGGKFPERYFDVGIAEEHALTFSAGLAAAGLSPYVAIYSTFLQRGYDNILHDIALQNLPVKILIDRAGLSLGDGATHHGIFDVSFLIHIPNVSLYAPICYRSLEKILKITENSKHPVAIRYSNSTDHYFVSDKFKYISESPVAMVLTDISSDCVPEKIFVTYGKVLEKVILAQSLLKQRGISSGIIVVESLKPTKELVKVLCDLLPAAKRILFVEEGILNGGFAATMYEKLGECGFDFSRTKIGIAAIDDSFAQPDKICDLYSYVGLSQEELVKKIND